MSERNQEIVAKNQCGSLGPWGEAEHSFVKVWLLEESFPALISAECAQDLSHAAVTQELAEIYPSCPVWPAESDNHTDSSDRSETTVDVLLTMLSPLDLARLSPLQSAGDKVEQEATSWTALCQPVIYPSGMMMVKAAHVMSRVRKHGLWEQSQTHQSLVPYLLEEAYELADVIATLPPDPHSVTASDTKNLIGELGDVFLEVLFHAAVGETAPDEAHFDYDDVAESFLHKLHKRMPYAFNGGSFPTSIAEQEALWQKSKQEDQQKVSDNASSPLSGIVRSQPALALVTEIVERALCAGITQDEIPPEFVAIAACRSEEDGTAEEQLRRQALTYLDHISGRVS